MNITEPILLAGGDYVPLAHPEYIDEICDAVETVTSQIITLRISYPLYTPVYVELSNGPYTRAELALEICNIYHNIYSGDIETWGHSIEDLMLHSVTKVGDVYHLGVDS